MRVVLLALFLAGCAGNTTITRTYESPNGTPVTETRTGNAVTYGMYVEAAEHIAAARAREAPVSTCAHGDSVCAVAVAGFNAIAALQSQSLQLQAPPRERDGAEKFRDIALGLTAITVPLFNTYQNVRTSRDHRDQQVSLFGTLERVVGSNNDLAREVATAGPRIDVGGDYISGQVGDNITGDGNAVAHDNGVANSGTNVGRDQTGGDHNEGSATGDNNRIDSPSFDNVGNGGNCQGGNGAAGGAGGAGGETPGGVGGDAAPGGPGGDCSGDSPGG